MAFEKIGFGGVLTFDDSQAQAGMKRANQSFQVLTTNTEKFSAGVSKMGKGLKQLGTFSAISGVAMGVGAKYAINFEKEMSAVGAVTRATSKEMSLLTDEAQRQGIVSAFSASQAAQAMQHMGRAGFKTKEIISGLGSIINAAAAEGIDLATATQIVAGSLRTMSLQASDAGKVADVLALTSTSTTTSMMTLGESFAYGGTVAKQLGLDLQLTSATFGLLGQKMISGSRAGTALQAIFRGLTSSSSKVKKIFKSLGVDTSKFGNDLSKLPDVIDTIKSALDRTYGKNTLLKFQAAKDIFGRQGVVAFNALASQGGKALKNLTSELNKASTQAIRGGKAIGAAQLMAERRLNNVSGAMTLFKSSVESAFIIGFKPFLRGMKVGLQTITGRLNDFLTVMRALGKDSSFKNQEALASKYGKTVVQVALGVRDAFGVIKSAIGTVRDAINEFGKRLSDSFSGTNVRQIAKVITVILGLMTVITPLLGSMFVLKFLIGGLANLFIGAFTAFSAAAFPIIAIVGGIIAALLILRNEGESLFQTAIRLLTSIYDFAKNIYKTALLPLFKGIISVVKAFTVEIAGFWSDVAGMLKNIILGVVSIFKNAIKTIISILKPVGRFIAAVIIALRPAFKAVVKFLLNIISIVVNIGKTVMKVLAVVGKALGIVIDTLRPVVAFIVKVVSQAFGMVMSLINYVVSFVSRAIGIIGSVFAKIFSYILPLFRFMKALVKLVIAIGATIWEVWVKSLKHVFNWVKSIATQVWNFIYPGFRAVFNALKPVLRFIFAIGRALKTAVMEPLKVFAFTLAGILDGLRSVVTLIPGVTASSLKNMSDSLRKFAIGKAPKAIKPTASEQVRARVAVPLTPEEQHRMARERFLKEQKAKEKKEREKKPTISLKDERKISLRNTVCIDGREVAGATARHKLELNERAGYGTTPWQRRAVVARARDIQPPDR